jgi:hypothetical protein
MKIGQTISTEGLVMQQCKSAALTYISIFETLWAQTKTTIKKYKINLNSSWLELV